MKHFWKTAAQPLRRVLFDPRHAPWRVAVIVALVGLLALHVLWVLVPAEGEVFLARSLVAWGLCLMLMGALPWPR